MKNSNNSFNSFGREQGKDNIFNAQIQKVYNALLVKPMTMKEIDAYSGVMRENICRYIKTLKEQKRIALIRKRKCSITGNNYVGEYTADKNLFPFDNQLNLF